MCCFALRNKRAHTFSASDDRCVCFFIANAESARQFSPTCASGPLACLPASPLMQSAKIAAGRRNGACLHQSSAIAQNRGFCAKRSGNAAKLQAELPLGLLKAQFAATWWSCGDLHPGLTVSGRVFYILIPPIELYASDAGERAFDACRPQSTHRRAQPLPKLSSA